MTKPKKLIITRYVEGEFAFLSGLADPKFENHYVAYEKGTCSEELGFNYYSLSKSSEHNTILKNIISKLEYVLSKPGQLNIISFKIIFLKLFWQSSTVELHLVYNFMPLFLIKFISYFKKCEWVIHDQTLLTGHCITPVGCGRNIEGCGKCPDLLRTNKIKYDRTRRNLIKNKKFISEFKGKFIFTNKNFRDLFISQQKLLLNRTEIRRILVKESSNNSEVSKKSDLNIGVNVAGRFEKNDFLVAKVLKALGSESRITFNAIGGTPNGWINKKIQNLKMYGQLLPWDVERILSMSHYYLILSTDESLGLMFVEAINSNSIPILLEKSPIIKNYNLDSYLSMSGPNDLFDIVQKDSTEKRQEILLNYKRQVDLFYE
jgi:hypothetical protein